MQAMRGNTIPCFLGRSTVNLCNTSLVLPCSVPNSAPLPSITIKPNLLSSESRAVSACVHGGEERVDEHVTVCKYLWQMIKLNTQLRMQTNIRGLTSVWNLLSQRYREVLIGLKGSKSILTFFSLPSSVTMVPQYTTKPFGGTGKVKKAKPHELNKEEIEKLLLCKVKSKIPAYVVPL